VARALVAAEITVFVLIGRNWAYVTTYRLYLDHVDGPKHTGAAQQFEIEGRRVMPLIVTRGPDRLAFSNRIGRDSEVRVEARPVSRVTYSIQWRDGSLGRTLAAGTIDTTTPIVGRFPTGNGVIELVSDGAVIWADPRVVRDLTIGRHSVILGVLLVGSFVCRQRFRASGGEPHGSAPGWWVKACTGCASVLFALIAAEVALRAIGDFLPSGIANERRSLGEVVPDPRWAESTQYGRRLRRRVDTLNEWRYGDIVRMGYIPRDVSRGPVHRFRFTTDREGFRNSVVRDHFDVAALGDSFTDAQLMPEEASWPVQLERRIGAPVRNYGTAGFGPQQELRVLKEFVAVHRPSRVVLAFFAGNDIFDAEGFDDFERSGEWTQRSPGWPIKEIISRSNTWYLTSAWNAAVTGLSNRYGTTFAEVLAPRPITPEQGLPAPNFDRGMFTVPVNGHVMSWAFMPPYLNTLNLSERDFAERRGWTLTRAAILEMQRVTRDLGGEFVVMFLPFKSQVYWPLLERSLSRASLRSALQFYLNGNQRPVDLDAMRRNRLAQNRLLRRLCEEADIPFVDTTDVLEAHVDAGENVYFPDDSHLNEVGEALVAETLAAFLSSQSKQAGR
jgi:lysophospholipase L1-like esterase